MAAAQVVAPDVAGLTGTLRQQLAAEKTRMARAKASESISVWVRDDIGEGIGQLSPMREIY